MRLILLLGCGPDATPPPLLWESPSDGRDAFFSALETGDYAALDGVLEGLQAEDDPKSAAVAGFAHAWKLAESQRDLSDPAVREHAGLAVEAFDAALQELDDSRLVGFRGSFKQAQGSIEESARLQRQGWFDQNEATRRWPEWGLFNQAYGLITFSPDERRFEGGIDLFWENLDACAGEAVDREDPDWLARVDAVESADWRVRRACSNTDVAPHNAEGFFIVMGDMAAKGGDTPLAATLYDTALALDDGTWPYRALAEDRLARVDELPDLFADPAPRDQAVALEDQVVFTGQASCTVCHQAE